MIGWLSGGDDRHAPAPRLADAGYRDLVEAGSVPQPSAASGRGIAERAARGVSGPGGPLPYQETIQAAFGRHDVSRIVAHTDEPAAASARAIGAAAFTIGDHVAFAREPGLRTAAHEAAHAVQQRVGTELVSGVGPLGVQLEPLGARRQSVEQSDAQLESHVVQLYAEIRRGHPRREQRAALDQGLKELLARARNRARSLSEEQVSKATDELMNRFLAAAPESGEQIIADLYWYAYRLEALRAQREAVMGFPADKVKAFQAAAPRSVRRGDQQCLETFMHHLQQLYSQEELDLVHVVADVRRTLAVNNIFKTLEARSPAGVAEQAIIHRAAAQGITEEQTRDALLLMQTQHVVTLHNRRWISTGEPFQGLLDMAMDAFAAEHQQRTAAEARPRELDVPVKPMHGIQLTTIARPRDPADHAQVASASRDLARKLLAAIDEYLRPVRPGHFFFGLSLHRGYHSVMLHAEISQNFKLKLFWKDQTTSLERPRSDESTLAGEIESFWPSYWPEFSTVWPLLPSAEQASGGSR